MNRKVEKCFSCDEVKECEVRHTDWNQTETICEECWDDMLSCSECEVVQYYENMYSDSSGETYCEGCYDMLIETCESCYEAVKGCERYGEEGYYFCQECIKDIKSKERQCDECESVSTDTKRWYNSQYIGGYIELCGECGSTCSCCMEFKKVEDLDDSDSIVKVCEECREQMFNCEECKNLVNVEHSYADSCGNLYCEWCYECEVKMCNKCEEYVRGCRMIGGCYYCEVCKDDVCQKCGSHNDQFGVKLVNCVDKDGKEVENFCEDCIEECEGYRKVVDGE